MKNAVKVTESVCRAIRKLSAHHIAIISEVSLSTSQVLESSKCKSNIPKRMIKPSARPSESPSKSATHQPKVNLVPNKQISDANRQEKRRKNPLETRKSIETARRTCHDNK
ncbi:uncharacterized protein RSE6_07088 [Rhynchosporium secalis]|uniref:Uncharacterized protein n=1 Tax=Rhynchosporium secalis TaxID=38038 RepID=A0A1E1MBZ5_RHYSE|nr:uncharacterized protein RSE6_07088 [Rhynchosporium secalis]